jgi:hypothetical protein
LLAGITGIKNPSSAKVEDIFAALAAATDPGIVKQLTELAAGISKKK